MVLQFRPQLFQHGVHFGVLELVAGLVDNEGNIYVVNAGGQSIRKISYPDGYVTIAAGGTMSGETETDGLPLECTFLYPKDIAMDSEENFYIAGGAGLNVRKLAIE